MSESGDIIRAKISELPEQTQADIRAALKGKGTFKSEGKDAAAWFILGLCCSIGGMIAGMYVADWSEAWEMLRAGWISGLFGDQIAAPGFVLSVIVAFVIIRGWILYHGHYGNILLPDAIGKIRGRNIILAPFHSIAKIRSSSFEMSNRNAGTERTVYTTEIVMRDNTSLLLYNCGLDIAPLMKQFGERGS